MVDTARTKSALATLFADNTAGDISPQDLRDFLESMDLAYGELTQQGNTSATSDAAAFAGTFTLGNANLFDTPSGSRLRYTGAVTRVFIVTLTFADDVDTETNRVQVQIAKNGTPEATSLIDYDQVSSEVKTGATQAIVELAQNDYVEPWYTDGDGFAQSGTFRRVQLIARALFG